MAHIRRVELELPFLGPTPIDVPLTAEEKVALHQYQSGIVALIEIGAIQRCIDYMGNYFLIYRQDSRE